MTTDARETAGTGISGFVGAHALYDDAQREAADRVRRTVEDAGVATVRV